MSQAVPYVIAAVVFYGVDRMVRIIKSRVVTATVTTISEMHMTQLTVPAVNAGWRAGQHVRVRVLSTGMGLYGWLESHPYTIASACAGEIGASEGLVLLAKNSGRWTKRLHRIALANRMGTDSGSHIRILIDGPYGASLSSSSRTAHIFIDWMCRRTRVHTPT